MNSRRAPILRFLRDLALSLPVFYERRQHTIVNGDFEPVPGDGLRPDALIATRGGATSVTSLADFVRRTRATREPRANVDRHRTPRPRVDGDAAADADDLEA